MREIFLPEDIRRDPLYVAQGKAFGSGEHETTRSCIEKILKYQDCIRGKAVLDVGTGTGVLAALMGLIGASSVFATDIEREAISVARKTCRLNGLKNNTVHLVMTDVLNFRGEIFTFAILNVHGPVLSRMARDLYRIMKNGAVCVLSGIVWEENYDVKSTYVKEGFSHIDIDFMDDYITMEFGKRYG